MEPDPLERYVALRKQITELEAELEELKPQIAEKVYGLGNRVIFGDHILRSQVSKSYAYSPAVDELQRKLTEKKREEVATGVAQLKKETRFVTMSSVNKPPTPPHDPETDDEYPY